MTSAELTSFGAATVSDQQASRAASAGGAVEAKFVIFFHFFWGLANVDKLWEAFSRLYRSRLLQLSTRLKALDEINKIYTLLHRSEFNNSATFRQKNRIYAVLVLKFHLLVCFTIVIQNAEIYYFNEEVLKVTQSSAISAISAENIKIYI